MCGQWDFSFLISVYANEISTCVDEWACGSWNTLQSTSHLTLRASVYVQPRACTQPLGPQELTVISGGLFFPISVPNSIKHHSALPLCLSQSYQPPLSSLWRSPWFFTILSTQVESAVPNAVMPAGTPCGAWSSREDLGPGWGSPSLTADCIVLEEKVRPWTAQITKGPISSDCWFVPVILFAFQSNTQGESPHYFVENLTDEDHWLILKRFREPAYWFSANLIRTRTAEERINSRMSCTIKYQIVMQLGVLLVNSVLFPDIRYPVSSSCSILLILKCAINLDCTLAHNWNSALKLENSILDWKWFLSNVVELAGPPVKTNVGQTAHGVPITVPPFSKSGWAAKAGRQSRLFASDFSKLMPEQHSVVLVILLPCVFTQN